MANRLELRFEVEGTGLRDLRNVSRELQNVNRSAGTASRGISSLGDIITGTFTGNLIADFFRSASRAAVDFAKDAVTAAGEAADAFRFLRAQTQLTGTNLAENVALVERLREKFGLSRDAAERLVAQTLQFTGAAGRIGDTEKFLVALADSAAASGRSLSELPVLISQISAGQDEATDKLFAKNPSVIYEEYARSAGKTAAQLTNAEQKQALLNATLTKGALVAGTAAERLGDAGGKAELAANRFRDLQVAVGEAITSNEGYIQTLDRLTAALDGLANPESVNNFRELAQTIALVGQGAAYGLGLIATNLNLIKTAFTVVALGAQGLIVLFTAIGKSLSLSIQGGVNEAIAAMQSTLPIAAQVAIGIAGVNTGATRDRIKADLAGIAEELKAFGRLAAEAYGEDVARFTAIARATAAGADIAGAFGRFRPGQAPGGAFAAGAARTVAGLAPTRTSAGALGALGGLGGGAVDSARLAAMAENVNRLVDERADGRAPRAIQPVLLASGDTLESVDALVRTQADAAATLAGATRDAGRSNRETIGELKATIGRLEQKIAQLPALSVLRVEAGPATIVDDVTPAGGVTP
jgi:hypothetical protein